MKASAFISLKLKISHKRKRWRWAIVKLSTFAFLPTRQLAYILSPKRFRPQGILNKRRRPEKTRREREDLKINARKMSLRRYTYRSGVCSWQYRRRSSHSIINRIGRCFALLFRSEIDKDDDWSETKLCAYVPKTRFKVFLFRAQTFLATRHFVADD